MGSHDEFSSVSRRSLRSERSFHQNPTQVVFLSPFPFCPFLGVSACFCWSMRCLPTELLLLALGVGLQVEPSQTHGLHSEAAALGALLVAQEDLQNKVPKDPTVLETIPSVYPSRVLLV